MDNGWHQAPKQTRTLTTAAELRKVLTHLNPDAFSAIGDSNGRTTLSRKDRELIARIKSENELRQ